MKLKKLYSSREVSALTGLSARQLQWWDGRRLFAPAVATRRTERGGFTARRYTPVDVLELMVLADLRRRGFSVPRIRQLLDVLHTRFGVRLFEAIEGGGPVTLFIDGRRIVARTEAGDIYNLLDDPTQPLLMLGDDLKLRQLTAREGKRPARARRASARARAIFSASPSKRPSRA
ncbi:MAG: MerR family transcriptional regulator [Vicinamibacterales bacterium]